MRAKRDIGFGPGRSARRPKSNRPAPSPKRGEREAKTLVRRRRIYRLRRILRAVAASLLVVGSVATYRSGLADAALQDLDAGFASAAANAGFVVHRIEISGTTRIPDATVRQALGIREGAPIFSFDMDAARARIEALGWVKSAAVARELPDSVAVAIVERKPFALWQQGGAFHLIDRDGAVIATHDLGQFSGLPVVVGDGADTAAAPLVDMMASEPTLAGKVRSAVRVGERRWDVIFQNGMRARLPESGEARAWRQLAALVRKHDLLARAVHIVDLRQKDRIVLRLTRDAAKQEQEQEHSILTNSDGDAV